MRTHSNSQTLRLVSGRSSVRSRHAAPFKGAHSGAQRSARVANRVAIGASKGHTTGRWLSRIAVAWIAFVLIVGNPFAFTMGEEPPSADASTYLAYAQATTAGDLLAANDCWTGAAPKDMQGKVPGHVVASATRWAADNNPSGTRLGGERAVALALGQLFEGKDAGLAIHGFCR